jgi:hypothetical protein
VPVALLGSVPTPISGCPILRVFCEGWDSRISPFLSQNTERRNTESIDSAQVVAHPVRNHQPNLQVIVRHYRALKKSVIAESQELWAWYATASMIRTMSMPGPIAAILAGMLSVGAFAQTPVWANTPGASPAIASGAEASEKQSDDTEEASRLTVVADFNRDGIVDIAKATSRAGNSSGPGILMVSLGKLDGTFRQTFSKPVLGHDPRSIVAVDANRDGIADLIVGDDDGSLTLFLGDGAGNLVAAGNIAHLDSVVSITVGDFNHDGIPDMAVSDWRSGSLVLLFGVSDGSFARGRSFPLRMPGTVPNLVAADFNKDGIPDLAVVYGDDGAYTYDVMLGDGKGNFSPSPELSFFRDPNSHCNT